MTVIIKVAYKVKPNVAKVANLQSCYGLTTSCKGWQPLRAKTKATFHKMAFW